MNSESRAVYRKEPYKNHTVPKNNRYELKNSLRDKKIEHLTILNSNLRYT
ncbi:MAG: hypothetical protein QG591_1027 [Planctomycetota bacterium]|nr:hypothetical protein [Planctomycetota bacterium]